MCGACGRHVAADPVFPEGRTLRGNLIAAQMINELCSSVTPRVKVGGHADGFVVSQPGRRQELCSTVGEAWAAVFAAAPARAVVLDGLPDEQEGLPDEQEGRHGGRAEHRLLQAVIAAGLEAVRLHVLKE